MVNSADNKKEGTGQINQPQTIDNLISAGLITGAAAAAFPGLVGPAAVVGGVYYYFGTKDLKKGDFVLDAVITVRDWMFGQKPKESKESENKNDQDNSGNTKSDLENNSSSSINSSSSNGSSDQNSIKSSNFGSGLNNTDNSESSNSKTSLSPKLFNSSSSSNGSSDQNSIKSSNSGSGLNNTDNSESSNSKTSLSPSRNSGESSMSTNNNPSTYETKKVRYLEYWKWTWHPKDTSLLGNIAYGIIRIIGWLFLGIGEIAGYYSWRNLNEKERSEALERIQNLPNPEEDIKVPLWHPKAMTEQSQAIRNINRLLKKEDLNDYKKPLNDAKRILDGFCGLDERRAATSMVRALKAEQAQELQFYCGYLVLLTAENSLTRGEIQQVINKIGGLGDTSVCNLAKGLKTEDSEFLTNLQALRDAIIADQKSNKSS